VFRYKAESIFSDWNVSLKALISITIIALGFYLNNTLYLLCLFILTCSLMLVAGFRLRELSKLVLMLIPFTALYAVFLVLMSKQAMILALGLRIPTVIMGFSFFTSTTDVFVLVKLLKKLNAPKQLYLPVYIILRFFPTLEKDYEDIRQIQQIRGFHYCFTMLSPKKLFRFLKSYFLPLLYTAFERADELAIAFYLRERRDEVKRSKRRKKNE